MNVMSRIVTLLLHSCLNQMNIQYKLILKKLHNMPLICPDTSVARKELFNCVNYRVGTLIFILHF